MVTMKKIHADKVKIFEVKVLFSIFIFVYFINYDGLRVIHKIKPMLKRYHMNISKN